MLRPVRQTSSQCSNRVHDNTKTTKSVQHQHTWKCGCSSQGPGNAPACMTAHIRPTPSSTNTDGIVFFYFPRPQAICMTAQRRPVRSTTNTDGSTGCASQSPQQCLCVPTGCITRHRRPIGTKCSCPSQGPKTSPLCCSSSASQTHKKFGMQAKQCKERISILVLRKPFLVQTFFLVCTGGAGFCLLLCVAWSQQKMGFRGGSVAHHDAGSTSAIRQLATEGEAQFVSRGTFEGPVTTVFGCEEGSGHTSPEEQGFFHPGRDHCSGARPRSCGVIQSQRCVAEGGRRALSHHRIFPQSQGRVPTHA